MLLGRASPTDANTLAAKLPAPTLALLFSTHPSGVVGSWPGPPAPPPACPVALAAAYLAPEEPGVGGQPPRGPGRRQVTSNTGGRLVAVAQTHGGYWAYHNCCCHGVCQGQWSGAQVL